MPAYLNRSRVGPTAARVGMLMLALIGLLLPLSGASATVSDTARVDIVFLIGESEYDTHRTLPQFAEQELKPRGLSYSMVAARPEDPNSFPGIEALHKARLLVLSVRRRTPPQAQLDLIRAHLTAGKPLVAIRTASHAFAAKPAAGEGAWPTFDADVLGATYAGYDGAARETGGEVWTVRQATGHPVLEGLENARFLTPAWIYKMHPLASGTTLLMEGRWPGGSAEEPVAWTNTYQGARVFYTSLGHPGDFRIREFRLLLLNAIFWALEKPAPGELLAQPQPPLLEFGLQTRDPQSDRPVTTLERVDPRQVGIVIIDMWNYHHCMTAAQRVGMLVPRMNRALAAARRLHMQVLFAPTDVSSQYVGTPQRERALAVVPLPVPMVSEISCSLRTTLKQCMCGPGIECVRQFGWDAMQPGLHIGPDDLITFGPEELYANSKALGLTHLIYMGVHTNACVLGRPEGMKRMAEAGLRCMLARDLTDALTYYDPETGFTPDTGTAEVVADMERSGLPSIDMLEEMKKAEDAPNDNIPETVRITPWGTPECPYQFKDSVIVSLTAPALSNAALRYTLDGAEPVATSTLYTSPLKISESVQLRVAAFCDGRRVTRPSVGEFVRLAALPSAPDVYLDQLKPVPPPKPDLGWQPRINEAFNGGPLRVRGQTYARGIGMRAPSNIVYELRPEFRRFVALAGVDDDLYRQRAWARYLSTHASVRFRIFIDGKLAAESPVLRFTQEPWRFVVDIPEGSRQISLAAIDAGTRSPLDLADWVEAGFMLAR